MNQEETFQRALRERPADLDLRLVFADWLEERGDARAELLRLSHRLTQELELPERPQLEERQRRLLAEGVQPVGPFAGNSLGMQFAWCPPGTFLMGSPDSEDKRRHDETQHRVRLTKGFYLGVTPVTQAQWQVVMGDNPSYFKGDNLPVEQVSWDDCQEFCRQLTQKDGKEYRLPTEAEWEYACRAGTTTPFYFGTACNATEANCHGSYPCGSRAKGPYLGQTSVVGSYEQKAPHPWGLSDMHGNVWEWCQDWYGAYPESDLKDPQGPGNGGDRVVRGGSWNRYAGYCRAAYRFRCAPAGRSNSIGLRVCFRLD